MIKEIIPVIHFRSVEQVFTNIDICQSHNLNKVFLINHEYGYEGVIELNNCISLVQDKYPDLWIGVNYLQLDNNEALTVATLRDVNALWCDNAGILKQGDEVKARLFYNKIKSNKKILYFGGIEFKYQKQPKTDDLPFVYENAKNFIDIVTTSGDGTGIEIDINKLKRIREGVGENKIIAIASGVDKNNIKALSQYGDIFMVASSITEPNEIINSDKLKQLIENLD